MMMMKKRRITIIMIMKIIINNDNKYIEGNVRGSVKLRMGLMVSFF